MAQTLAEAHFTKLFDIVLYGATGFTGFLVAEYLRDHAQEHTKWAIAGRSRTKLEKVLQQLGRTQAEVPILIADSGDLASLNLMCRSARVVISTVGPYMTYGTGLVAACVESGAHYCDITGEPHFIQHLITQYHDAAVEQKVLLVNCCGFDSVPADIGNMLMLKHASQRFPNRRPKSLTSYYTMKAEASGGSIATAMAFCTHPKKNAGTKEKDVFPESDRSSILPTRIPYQAPRKEQQLPAVTPQGWSSPFIMESINSRVVNRSNFFRGQSLSYSERAGPSSFLSALAGSLMYVGIGLFLHLRCLQCLFSGFIPKPGEGPSLETRKQGYFDTTLVLAFDDEEQPSVMVGSISSHCGDPGYTETAKMLAEAALCLAFDTRADVSVSGGVHTPSIALGEQFAARLERSGISLKF